MPYQRLHVAGVVQQWRRFRQLDTVVQSHCILTYVRACSLKLPGRVVYLAPVQAWPSTASIVAIPLGQPVLKRSRAGRARRRAWPVVGCKPFGYFARLSPSAGEIDASPFFMEADPGVVVGEVEPRTGYQRDEQVVGVQAQKA